MPKSVVNRYTRRPLRSYDWVKDLSFDDLYGRMNKILPPPHFGTMPFRHQLACFLVGIHRRAFLFFLDLGTGKSKIILDMVHYRKFTNEAERTLVLVPNEVNIRQWVLEQEKHQPHLVSIPLLGGKAERLVLLQREADLYIINYAGLLSLVTNRDGGAGRVRGKLRLDPAKVAWLAGQFRCVVFDECQAFKSWRTLTFQACAALAGKIKYRYGLTGTPFGRDAQDLWAQFRVVDGGETFGLHLNLFRAAYFAEKVNYWGGYEYKLRADRRQQLHDAMKNRSIRYRDVECVDMPDTNHVRLSFDLPNDTMIYYTKTVERMREMIAQRTERVRRENLFLRLRMLSSGFLSMPGQDGEDRVEIVFPHNPKLDALLGLVDQLPAARKMVVFNEFIKSGDIVCAALAERKVPHARLYSGTKDPAAELDRFMGDPACRLFVMNNQSGAAGLNLQVANYVVFYESPVSPIVRAQAEGRCVRTGQERRVHIYDLVCRGTSDETVLKYLREGKNLFRSLMDAGVKDIVTAYARHTRHP